MRLFWQLSRRVRHGCPVQSFPSTRMGFALFKSSSGATCRIVCFQQTISAMRRKRYFDSRLKVIGMFPSKSEARLFIFLLRNPTPPVFDGPEDRNGRRNHDEIRLWADYISESGNEYIYDDQGKAGGLPSGAQFVIAGDYNADPVDGDSIDSAISQILDHPLVNQSQLRRALAASKIASPRETVTIPIAAIRPLIHRTLTRVPWGIYVSTICWRRRILCYQDTAVFCRSSQTNLGG